VNTRICQDGAGLSLDYIASQDGTGSTLLVAENLRSMKPHTWWDTEPKVVGFTDGPMAFNVQSNHAGGAVVTFCDGHTAFLRDDIEDGVYQALVTPDGGEKVEADKI
jgi:prepilin-type processing-associated H-X9-DG protein